MKVHGFNLRTTIRGRDVQAIGTWVFADASVGLFGIEADYEIVDNQNGNKLDWELTDKEYDDLCNLIKEVQVDDYMVGDYIEED